MFKQNSKYLIKTKNGFEFFSGVNKKLSPSYIELKTKNTKLKCSESHKIETIENKFIEAKNLSEGDVILTESGIESIESIKIIKDSVFVYDPINTGKDNCYISNGVVSHNCEFLGTGDTFVDGEILKQLKEQINEDYSTNYNNRLRIWHNPNPSRDYVIGVDTSIGRGLDASVAQIIDLYSGEQVAEFRSVNTPINEFARIVVEIARKYNTAYIIPERNLIGHNLIYHMKEVEEYENIFLDDKHEPGIQVADANRRQMLVEMDEAIRLNKIKINSDRTVDELLTFIIDEVGRYKADVNCHDDLIMGLALAVYGFNHLRANTPMIQHRPNDENKLIVPVSRAKYMIRTPGGLIEEEDLKWLIS
jgi:hypothetical protein